MTVLIIFPVILQTVINLIMLSIGGQGQFSRSYRLPSFLGCITNDIRYWRLSSQVTAWNQTEYIVRKGRNKRTGNGSWWASDTQRHSRIWWRV